jgi:hypothetical protein
MSLTGRPPSTRPVSHKRSDSDDSEFVIFVQELSQIAGPPKELVWGLEPTGERIAGLPPPTHSQVDLCLSKFPVRD